MKLRKLNTTDQPPSDLEKKILLKLSYGATHEKLESELNLKPDVPTSMIAKMIDRYSLNTEIHLVATAIKRGWIE